MIEKRLAQWYAADAGVDLDIAEREIASTYVLRILADHGLLARMAFKGGTAIRKIYLGNQGRFSLDLDFTATEDTDPEALILDVAGLFHNQVHHGLVYHPHWGLLRQSRILWGGNQLPTRVVDFRKIRASNQFPQ